MEAPLQALWAYNYSHFYEVLNSFGRFHASSPGDNFSLDWRDCEMEDADWSTLNKLSISLLLKIWLTELLAIYFFFKIVLVFFCYFNKLIV